MTFNELFKIILSGNENQSHEAARKVRKFLYSSRSGGKNEYKQIKNIINAAANTYAKIVEDWRRENFVMAVSVIYYLHDRESEPDFLFPWLFQLLQNKNGNIRQAAVRMIQNELGPLTYHIRFPGRKSDFHKFSSKKADQILIGLRINLDRLAEASWKDSYKKYKYVVQLPSGTYKSTQLILGLLDDYYSEVDYPASSQIKAGSNQEILERRKEIEQELVDMLKEMRSDFTLDHVHDVIYNEEDNDDMMKVVAMFDRGGDASELSNVLELVSDAWNYFPHKGLGGISPAEKILEYQNTQGKKKWSNY